MDRYSVLSTWFANVCVGNTPSYYYTSLMEQFTTVGVLTVAKVGDCILKSSNLLYSSVAMSSIPLTALWTATNQRKYLSVKRYVAGAALAVAYLWHRMVGNSPRKAQSVANWSAIFPFMSLFPITPGEKTRRKDSGKLRVKTLDSFGRNPMYDSLRDFISGVWTNAVCDVWMCECATVWISYSKRLPYNSWMVTAEV